MNRNITEFLKISEVVRVPVLGGLLYKLFNKWDNKSILREKLPLKHPKHILVNQAYVKKSIALWG